MATLSLNSAQLETVIEAVLNDDVTGMKLLNILRVKNAKTAYPANYHNGDINVIEPATLATAYAAIVAAVGT